MTIKLTANLNNPPISGLATALLINETVPVEIVWGKETALQFPDNRRLICHSNNDVLRALARAAPEYKLYGETAIERTQIDHWLSFSLTCEDDISWAMSFLDKSTAPVTHLVANKLTIADFALFNEMYSRYEFLAAKGIPQHVQRWYDTIRTQPLIQKVLQTLPQQACDALKRVHQAADGIKERESTPTGLKTSERKQEGKFVDLPGAEMGKVVVRFPPEASGYLHIGHAKAALLNQYYADAFNGKLIMRFDDTNPAKETVEFEEVILGDLELLQIKPDVFTHTSNYFDLMLEYCEQLIKEGKAYVDDTPPEQMKAEREQRTESKHRSNDVQKNMTMWQEMTKGTEYGQKCCVRAKIDMSSPNGCLRDPTIYRCKNEPHPRTGTKYKVYPTYDFACPIVDAIEGVTHTLRTMEYHDRDDQFYWFIDALKLRKPYIWEYSRLNMTNTVLSKRKLTWFVDSGLVDGWDDPRFPTVRGIIRRGMTVEGLREFIIAQGSSKSVVFMNWDKIWAFNKKVIDPIAPRYTALEYENRVVVNVDGAKYEQVQVPVHPKNESLGTKTVTLGPCIYIDYADAEALKEGENTTFINWGNLLIKKIHKDASGKITSVDAALNLDNKDFKKTLKLTWLAVEKDEKDYPPTFCVYFDNIISKAVLGKDEDFKQYIGHKTREEVNMLGDPELKKCKKGDIIQLQRRGFFKVDTAYAPPNPYTNVATPVILLSIPDGHTKDMPSSGLKINATAQDAKKSDSAQSVDADDLNNQIAKQGDIVRDLKAKKAAKEQIDTEVKKLLTLKANYKAATGKDWKPGQAAAPPSADLDNQIAKQGDIVRDLKTKKAAKEQIDVEVKKLLALKADYKAATGKDWKPGQAAAPPSADLDNQIAKQGDIVRDLKTKKAAKEQIDVEVKKLLALKADYKAATGKDWKPGQAATPPNADLDNQIVKQGDIVRDLKTKKAAKEQIDVEVKKLLALKADYKAATGKDWKPGQAAAPPSANFDSKIIKQNDIVPDLKEETQTKPVDINLHINILKALRQEFESPDKIDPSSFQFYYDIYKVIYLLEKIPEKIQEICQLKSANADKAIVAAEESKLLKLKASYNQLTFLEYKADTVVPKREKSPEINSNPNLKNKLAQLVKQEEKVRQLKANKANQDTFEREAALLLALKFDFYQLTSEHWTPGTKVLDCPEVIDLTGESDTNVAGLLEKIKTQGDKIRKLKAEKAGKAAIDPEVQKLLAFKVEYKNLTGTEWTPDAKAEPKATMSEASEKDQLTKEINDQGEKVRTAKANNAPKEQIDAEVKKLLALKGKYKEVTGTDFPVAARDSKSAKKPSEKKVKPTPVKKETPTDASTTGLKKQTRLGLEVTKEENLSDWYSQVITKGELIEYYDVSGCYILRHWSFAIWKQIKNWFDAEITKRGVKECYFPIFVSKAALEKEKTHIADFAPEVAWVTKSGESDLAEHIAVRPTSETVMYPAYAKWVQSYRDLPIRLNQWNNVVRWEFKHPMPFLRTREFLWQEGHTAFANKPEAEAEVLEILDLYAQIYTNLLAIPVVKGRKTAKERFAGGEYTTTVEAFISSSGRGIQGATSHHLGQNFSKMFEIVFEDPETQQKQYAYQNSWGITTRTIGVMIMVHADNRGLVLPPRVACVQAIIVPCGITASTKDDEREMLLKACQKLETQLCAKGIRCEGDYRDNYSPGWKFNHWELKGVPVRIELGPKDMKSSQIVAVRRDTGEKLILAMEDVDSKISQLLETIHDSMLAKAKTEMVEHTKLTKNWSDFCKFLDMKNLLLSPYCGDVPCEDKIKADSARDEDAEPGAPSMGAKALCIPMDQPAAITANDKCINPNCTNKPKYYTLFGRSY